MPILASSLKNVVPYETEYSDGTTIRITDYFGRPASLRRMDAVAADGPLAPESHLVEPLAPRYVIAPHYHIRDQFPDIR